MEERKQRRIVLIAGGSTGLAAAHIALLEKHPEVEIIDPMDAQEMADELGVHVQDIPVLDDVIDPRNRMEPPTEGMQLVDRIIKDAKMRQLTDSYLNPLMTGKQKRTNRRKAARQNKNRRK
jgi:hypothetical protein